MSWQKLFRVQYPTDFEPIEQHVSALLSAESDRSCAFVESAPFRRFRIRALYRTREMDGPLYGPNGVVLSFTPDPAPAMSGWVALSVLEEPRGAEEHTLCVRE